jgi:hypothetical protein
VWLAFAQPHAPAPSLNLIETEQLGFFSSISDSLYEGISTLWLAWPITLAISIEQFGYGLGFAAYLMYLLEFSRGPYQTAHYALCTGFMALGMMLPGLVCGYIQAWLGYEWFFVWVMLAAVPSLLATWWAPLSYDAGEE